MAQHDYNIEDQNGFDFLVDLNNVLSAIATNNAGSPEPNPTFPHMLWFDTNNLLMKVRNASNSAWDIVAAKDANGWTPYRQGTALGTASVQPDTRYAHRSNNLSDLGSATTARANLEIPAPVFLTQTQVEDANDTAFGQVSGQLLAQAVRDNLNVTDPAPLYACRAWVNFNGTGTVAIRASGNVSSITDNGTGDYTINFTTALPDANYAMVQGSANVAGALNSRPVIAGFNIDAAPTSSAARIYVKDAGYQPTDSTRVTLSFFR